MKIHLLEEKIEKAPSLDFGNILDESFKLFKKVWVQGFVMNLLSIVLIIPCLLIFYIPAVLTGISNPEVFANNNELPVEFYLIIIPVYLIIMVLSFMVSTLMRAGFYKICKNQDEGAIESDNYFYYFKKEYIGKVFVLALIVMSIIILATALCLLPLIYAMVPLSLIPLFFAFNPELTSREIIKASFKLGNKKWLLIFGLTFIAAFAAEIVGVFLCFIGVFFTASFAIIPHYIIYKKSLGFAKNLEEKLQENDPNSSLFLK